MKIGIDISPLKTGNFLQHRVRGTGFYLENLKASLLSYYPENKYIFFTRGEKLPNDIDIIHYPYFEPFFLTLPLFSKNKTVVTIHDLTPLVFPDHFKSGLKGNLRWRIQKLALKNASAIITDSESSKKDIIKYVDVDSAKVKVVYLAAGSGFKKLEAGSWKQEIKEKYNLPDYFALYVGDATWNKNLPRLIESTIKANVPLVMVGKALADEVVDSQNPWNSDLVKAHRLAAENKNILRLGFVSNQDLIRLYNLATVFIMPSIYEGFGLPALEAMSCGCPVITSKGGSLKEVVGEAGKFVDPNDANSIAMGIGEVFNNTELQKVLSQKGLVQAKKFAWKKTVEQTMEIYNSVAR